MRNLGLHDFWKMLNAPLASLVQRDMGHRPLQMIALEQRLLLDANPLIDGGEPNAAIPIEELNDLFGNHSDSTWSGFFDAIALLEQQTQSDVNLSESTSFLNNALPPSMGELDAVPQVPISVNVDDDRLSAEDSPTTMPGELLAAYQEDSFGSLDASARFALELVVIDESVGDFQGILNGLLQPLPNGREYTVLKIQSEQDGIEAITRFLEQSDRIDAIHIISHGGSGQFQLGSVNLNNSTIADRAMELMSWRAHLSSNADVLIYGCDLASNDAGIRLIDRLATLIDTDIAASDDLTGHQSLGGDWELEHQVGQIDSTIAVSDWSQEHWHGLLATTSGDTAIWRANVDTSPNAAAWDGSSFGPATNTANVGSWRIIDGAESATRDEKIVVGVDGSGVISAEIYSGGSWAAVPFSLATAQTSTDHGFDIAYESQSGDAMLIWNNGTTGSMPISYRVWNGIAWSAEQTITTPISGGVAQLELASSPSADQMALVANGQDSKVDFALVWNGSSWGNSVTLDALVGADHTDISVAFESLSGHAIATYDSNASTNAVQYRIWDGSTWSAEQEFAAPAGVGASSDVSWAQMASDPNSNRIALGILSDGNEVWYAVWDGSTWGSKLAATTNVVSATSMSMSLAFEDNSGDLLATYSELATTSVSYRTWTSGGGWSAEQSTPNLGAVSNAMTLSADPNSIQIMLSVQDANSDLHYLQWDGSSWGAWNTLETNSGETANQPFLFLYDASPNTAPTITSDGGGATATIFVPENSTAVTTVTASDADLPVQTLTFTIVGGADAAKFAINSSSGALMFVAAPNYETPTDAGGNNVYDVTVQVSDGLLSDSQAIAVTVTPANDNTPVITSNGGGANATLGIAENTTAVATITASDTDLPAETLIYSVSGGLDSTKFTIDSSTGVLSFVSAPNFELPSDVGADNDYEVIVQVSDGLFTDSQSIVVTVTNVNEAPVNATVANQSTPQDTALLFSTANGNLISINDVDAGGGLVQVTLTATNGWLTLGWPSGTVSTSGGEFRINTTTSDRQGTLDSEFFGGTTSDFGSPRAVAADSGGNYVVTWSSKNQDGDGWGVYAQRYNASGVAQGGEFRVNTETDNDEVYSSVAMDDNGNFVIVWSTDFGSGNWGINAQRYNAAGVAQGAELHVNTYINKEQLAPAVAMESKGGFVVTWSSKDQDGDNWGVYAQRYTAAGAKTGGEFRVNNTTANEQTASSVAMDANGGFVVTWSSKDQNGDSWSIFAKRYDAAGIPQGSEFQVNTTSAKEQEFPSVAMDAKGNFIVTWSSKDQDGDNWGVFAQRYNAAGVAQGGEFQVNLTTAREQMHSSVSMDADGDFVVTWTTKDQDGNGQGIYARQYDASGTAKGGETLVNTTTSGDQEYSSVAMDARGDFIVVWTGNGPGDTQGVFGQRFSAPTGLTFATGDGTRDNTMTFSGTLLRVNAALEGLVFTPNKGFTGLATLTIATDDLGNSGSGGPQSDTDTININVGTGNIAPTITLTGGSLSYTENDPATVIDSGFAVSDPDAIDFDGGQLTAYLSANSTSFDRLSIRNQGTGVGEIGVSGSNVTFNFGGGPLTIGSFVGGTDGITPLVIKLNANANLAAVQALAQNITYENLSDDPGVVARTVEFLLTDGDGGSSNLEAMTINVTAVNDGPSISAQSLSVMENSSIGTSVGFAVASDLDSGADGTLSYSIIGGTGATAFAINAATGEITVADPTQLDFETTTAFTLQVQVTDGGAPGLSSTATFTINLLNVNEAPTNVTPTIFSVVEGTDTTAGLNLGAFVTTDPDAGDSISYAILPGADAANFSIGGVAADELILTDGALDFETKSVYTFTLRATDSVGNFIDQVFTVNVNDVNESPLIANQTFGVNENSLNGAVVGTVVATDPDAAANGALSFTITGGTGATAFAINAATGEITVADPTQLDFETTTSFTLQVQVTDGGAPGLSSTATLTINVLNVNEAPTNLAPDGMTVAENSNTAGGFSVGVLTAADADAFESFTYSIRPGGDGALFSIGGVGSDELVLDDGVINYERQSSYSVTIRVMDSAGNFYDETLTINVVDQDEDPTAVAGGPYLINEGAGVLLDGLGSSDPEGSSLSYRWDLNNDGVFGDAVGATPTITWAVLNAWSITNQGNHSIGLQVSDGAGNTHAVTTTLTVNNLSPTAGNDAGVGFETDEDRSFITANLLVNDTDPNDNDVLTVVGLDLNGTRGLVVDNGDGTITYNPNGQFEDLNVGDTAFDTFVYILADEAGASVFGTVTVTISGVNDEQQLMTNSPLTVNEGANGSITALELTTSDLDDSAGNIVYRVAQATAQGRLELVSNPGVSITTFTQAQVNSGEVRYIHDGSETRGDSFDFSVDDGNGVVSLGRFLINVRPANDSPIAGDDTVFTAQGNSLTISRSELLANDSDVDSSNLTIQVVTGPAHGILVTNADGSITFQPSVGFSGMDSFEYQLSDGAASSNIAKVTIQVAAAGMTSNGPTIPSVSVPTIASVAPETLPPSPINLVNSAPVETADQLANAIEPQAPRQNSVRDEFDSTSIQIEDQLDIDGVSWLKVFAGLGARGTDIEVVGLFPTAELQFVTQAGLFWNALDGFSRQAESLTGLPMLITGSAAALSTSISVGYVVWLIRGGQVLVALMAHLPAWALIDPLPILGSFDKREEESDESLQTYLAEPRVTKTTSNAEAELASTEAVSPS